MVSEQEGKKCVNMDLRTDGTQDRQHHRGGGLAPEESTKGFHSSFDDLRFSRAAFPRCTLS